MIFIILLIKIMISIIYLINNKYKSIIVFFLNQELNKFKKFNFKLFVKS